MVIFTFTTITASNVTSCNIFACSSLGRALVTVQNTLWALNPASGPVSWPPRSQDAYLADDRLASSWKVACVPLTWNSFEVLCACQLVFRTGQRLGYLDKFQSLCCRCVTEVIHIWNFSIVFFSVKPQHFGNILCICHQVKWKLLNMLCCVCCMELFQQVRVWLKQMQNTQWVSEIISCLIADTEAASETVCGLKNRMMQEIHYTVGPFYCVTFYIFSFSKIRTVFF